MTITCDEFTLMFMTCSLCIVMTQSAGSAENKNYSQNLRFERLHTEEFLNIGKDEGICSHRGEGIGGRRRVNEESFVANQISLEGMAKDSNSRHVTEDGRKKTPAAWTNEKYHSLLRLAYLNYYGREYNGMGSFDWKKIFSTWNENYGWISEQLLRSQLASLQKKMGLSVEQLDEGIRWSKELNNHLLAIYFLTECGIKLKHGNRILAEWKRREYPGYERLTSEYLFGRAEKLVNSVMKFSLVNPQGPIRKRQNVEWQTEHNIYLRSLWHKYPLDTPGRIQAIYDEAKMKFPGIRFLEPSRVYEYTKTIFTRPVKSHKASALHERSVENATHIQYHSFLDEHDFPSASAGVNYYHGKMVGSSSHSRQSHGQPDSDSRSNIPDDRDHRSPDTTLRLG